MLTPGSVAFARQGIPRPTPASTRDRRRLAAGQSNPQRQRTAQ